MAMLAMVSSPVERELIFHNERKITLTALENARADLVDRLGKADTQASHDLPARDSAISKGKTII